MTDIVERLRRDAARFAAMDAAGDQPWVADAAWAAEAFRAAADEIERLRAALRRLVDWGAACPTTREARLSHAAEGAKAFHQARLALGEDVHD